MYITHIDERGVDLVYRSTRQGFTHYLMGKSIFSSYAINIKKLDCYYQNLYTQKRKEIDMSLLFNYTQYISYHIHI